LHLHAATFANIAFEKKPIFFHTGQRLPAWFLGAGGRVRRRSPHLLEVRLRRRVWRENNIQFGADGEYRFASTGARRFPRKRTRTLLRSRSTLFSLSRALFGRLAELFGGRCAILSLVAALFVAGIVSQPELLCFILALFVAGRISESSLPGFLSALFIAGSVS
jgi:hypothetical protein